MKFKTMKDFFEMVKYRDLDHYTLIEIKQALIEWRNKLESINHIDTNDCYGKYADSGYKSYTNDRFEGVLEFLDNFLNLEDNKKE